MYVLVLVFIAGLVNGDYDCICNYNVEKSVFTSASNQGAPIGYLYEFDCKPLIGDWSASSTWVTVAFEHHIGYIEKDAQTNSQTCPGNPPDEDLVTTQAPPSTVSTTIKQTTSVPSTTTTVMTSTMTVPVTTASTSTSTEAITTTTKAITTPSTTTTQPTTQSSTLQITLSSTLPTPESTTKDTTTVSTTLKPTTEPSTLTVTTMSSTGQSTTMSGKLACPLHIQQIAQSEGSIAFVNQNNGKCYELVTFTRQWGFAEDDCVKKGGHLTSINDATEGNLINKQVQAYGKNTWIGLNDKNTEENFKWTSGDVYSYQNWKFGHQDVGTHFTDDCVTIDPSSGQWDDESCIHYHGYICKFNAVIDNGTHVTSPQTKIFTAPTTKTTTPSTIQQSTVSGTQQLMCPQDVVQASNGNDNGVTFVSKVTNKCYELVRNHRSWDNAETDCQRKGGHLATIRSYSENTLIYSYVQSYGHIVWIGLNDENREEHFEWVSGEPVNYTNWHPGRKDPYAHRFEDCVAMGPLTGTWEDLDCLYGYHAYMCEFAAVLGHQGSLSSIDGDTQLCTSTVQHLAIRDNAIIGQFERGCYELIPNFKVSWQHGEDLCQSRGGHLAHISSSQQQSFIQTFLNRHSPQHAVWIGLHDTNIEGAFEWTAGTSLSYTNWIPGHISNFESFRTEDCVAFIPYKNGKWDDIPCGNDFDLGETHPILCQYKIPLSPGIVG